jgi:hypothetical protein
LTGPAGAGECPGGSSGSQARSALEEKGVPFIAPVFCGANWEWAYFRAPEGHVYQLMAEFKGSAQPNR